MKSLEIITLRSGTKPEKTTFRELVKEIEAADVEEGPVGFRLYRHAAVESDLSIHIHRENVRGTPAKSALGLELARLFGEFGLVNHSVWIEE